MLNRTCIFILVLLSLSFSCTSTDVTEQKTGKKEIERTVGLISYYPEKTSPGYILYPGKHHGMTVLMDNEGRIINSWFSKYEPGQSAYLLENGNMMRAALVKGKYNIGGGEGGRFEEYNWAGEMVWSMDYASDNYMSHHDFAPMKNGNFLALCVEKKSKAECVQAGFNPSLIMDAYVCPEYIIEVKKLPDNKYEIVWEWHIWDHLVQDYDRTKANYGDPVEHPGRLDIHSNQRGIKAFWNHANSIAYNEKLDQICISIRGTSEFWIIDHSTTTEQAATAEGGRHSKGGDILYRWGNPQIYHRGSEADRRLYQQHDANWIDVGCPGAGNILIFNNGIDRPGQKYSSIEEVVLPAGNGVFPALNSRNFFGPKEATWTYTTNPPTQFYSAEISGAQRMPNGNTLICAGIQGYFFEITPEGEVVWEYINPMVTNSILKQGEKAAIDNRNHPLNAIFKIHKYTPDYIGLAGRDLRPGKYLVE